MSRTDLTASARGAVVVTMVFATIGTGCDKLFSLDKVFDAGAPPSDARDASTAGDEDGDGVPNATDNCPVTDNVSQVDGDGDMVGDACDPNPQLMIDRIATVSYFDDPDAIDGGWSGANWAITSGTLQNSGPLELMQMLGMTGERATLEIAYTATHWEDQTSSVRLSLETNTVYVPCHVDFNVPEWIVFLDNGSFDSVVEAVSHHVVRLTATSSPVTCSINQRAPGTSDLTLPTGPSDVRVELVNTVRANLEYIIVYETRSQ